MHHAFDYGPAIAGIFSQESSKLFFVCDIDCCQVNMCAHILQLEQLLHQPFLGMVRFQLIPGWTRRNRGSSHQNEASGSLAHHPARYQQPQSTQTTSYQVAPIRLEGWRQRGGEMLTLHQASDIALTLAESHLIFAIGLPDFLKQLFSLFDGRNRIQVDQTSPEA